MDRERKSSGKSFLVGGAQGDRRLEIGCSGAAAEQKPLWAALTVAWNTGGAGRGGVGRERCLGCWHRLRVLERAPLDPTSLLPTPQGLGTRFAVK